MDKIDTNTIPSNIIDFVNSTSSSASPADIAARQKQLFAFSLRKTLFEAEPTAVVVKMLNSNEMDFGDSATTSKIKNFLSKNLDWNLRTTSVNSILQNPQALADLPENQQPDVVNGLRLLSRIQAISPSPEVIPALVKSNVTSAFQVASMPKSTFVEAFKNPLGDSGTAEAVFANATNIKVRNEMMLLSGIQAIRGTGLAVMDGGKGLIARGQAFLNALRDQNGPVNMETLFGDITSFCDCDECLSVHSPAAYYVELLQFLRNNNLDSSNVHTDQKTLTGTLLERLLQRRPDLAYIKLTCTNTNTTMPYLDLALEVMESYVAHAPSIDPFNVEEGTTRDELLAEPKHVNLAAYRALSQTAFPPAALPFSLPVTNSREFLKALGTTKRELLERYRSTYEHDSSVSFTPAEEGELKQIFATVQDRFADAEAMEMSHEDYVLITQQAFYPKRWFELTQRPEFDGSDLSYRKSIGFSEDVTSRYGYASSDQMFSTDSAKKTGISFVKAQLLPRLGISYVDLLGICQTWFMNPERPTPGSSDEQVIYGIKYSYRFLQSFVNQSETGDMEKRYGKLIDFLSPSPSRIAGLPAIEQLKKAHLDSILSTDDNANSDIWGSWTRDDWKRWIVTWFAAVGRMLVMQSGDEPKLPFTGELILATTALQQPSNSTVFVPGVIPPGFSLPPPVRNLPALVTGSFSIPGPSTSARGTPIFHPVGLGQRTTPIFTIPPTPPTVLNPVLKSPINSSWWRVVIGPVSAPTPVSTGPVTTLSVIAGISDDGNIVDTAGNLIGYVTFDGRLVELDGKLFSDKYPPPKNGLAVRTLNGDFLGIVDDKGYLRMFTTGNQVVEWSGVKDTCSIEETVLRHLDGTEVTAPEYEKLLAFLRLWKMLGWTVDETDIAIKCVSADGTISTDVIHQLVKINKLIETTTLSLTDLLPFWGPLDGQGGTAEIYSQLFLGYNTRSMDNVFEENSFGSYLSQDPPEKITSHIPILQATLKLSLQDINAIMEFRSLEDKLTITSLSALYRQSTLARALSVAAWRTPDIIKLLGDPFASPEKACDIFDLWNTIQSSSFELRQLEYLCADKDDPSSPIAIPERSVLVTVKALRDAVLGIDTQHKDISLDDDDSLTVVDLENLLRTELGLIFDIAAVDLIDQLLSGTGVYTTNAPKNLAVAIPPTLEKTFKYFAVRGAIQVVGILSQENIDTIKALPGGSLPNTEWVAALDRIQKQVKKHFDKVLEKFGNFPTRTEAMSVLLDASDPPLPATGTSGPKTATRKMRYFLHYFVTFLRTQLITSAITASLSGLTGLTNEVCQFLLFEVVTDGSPPRPAIEVLRSIAMENTATLGSAPWSGYLSPPTSGFYSFYIESDTEPAQIVLNRQIIVFNRQDDPTNLWISNPISLSGDVLYPLSTTGSLADRLDWSFGIISRTPVPQTAFLATDDGQKEVSGFLKKLQKFSILINGFALTVEEIRYFNRSQPINFSNFTIDYWKRLNNYSALVKTISAMDISLIELFNWAISDNDSVTLPSMVASATGWLESDVEKLLRNKSLTKSDFKDEAQLAELRKTLLVAQKVGVDIDILFSWSKPSLPQSFDALNVISDQIQAAFRKKYSSSDWNLAVKPINDQLRQIRKNALVAYLLVQETLKGTVVDADGLFEYFLIDCQMSPCMETSRIKQAISTVQLFVQRCLFGLEGSLLSDQTIDRQRWDALSSYRPWEASVKIRLWPENWAEPSIRDDKSQYFREFESDLMQKNLSSTSILTAFKSYLIKMDEISNLMACGIFVEQAPQVSWQFVSNEKIHLFARTSSTPANFLYRRYVVKDRTWSAWEEMKLDVPVYEDSDSIADVDIGTYLIPAVYKGRLLVFFPHFCKKTTVTSEPSETIPGMTAPLTQLKPSEMWEIKLSWSEYIVSDSGSGKWTSKQISEQAVYTTPKGANNLEGRSGFRFIPNASSEALTIDILQNFPSAFIGRFVFSSKKFDTARHPDPPQTVLNSTDFHLRYLYSHPDMHDPGRTVFQGIQLNSLQQIGDSQPFAMSEPYVAYPPAPLGHAYIQYEGLLQIFDMNQASDMLGKLSLESPDPLADMVGLTGDIVITETQEAYGGIELHELRYPNSIYFWEVGFHAIYLVTDQLLKSQQFEAALKMCSYIFDPLSQTTGVWKFPPFRKIAQSQAGGAYESSFMNLPPGEADARAAEWRNHPFEPHVVARGAPVAYMKMVVMKYIEILVAWGDDQFRRNTMETVPSAIQCYIFASHIYGPRGERIPARGTKTPQTYMSLLNNWDALSNAMVELELAVPTSNSPVPIGGTSDSNAPLAPSGASNLFGFATTLYFCVPNNPQLQALRDTIDDRLFKIRNCQDINGITRSLPLFEPPIDPGLLVQAVAKGVSISSALSDLNTPMPQYRFHLVLEKAINLCQELTSFSNQLLTVKERSDAESMALLQSRQEQKMRSLIMDVYTKQLDEADKVLDGLIQSRKSPLYQLKYHLKLLGIDDTAIPSDMADFQEINEGIDPPVKGLGINMITEEKGQQDELSNVRDFTIGIGALEAFVATLHSLPSISIAMKPWGIGASTSFGAEQIAAWQSAAARIMQTLQAVCEIKSRGLILTANAKRQAWERFRQANTAGYEMKNIDKQLISQRARIDVAAQEVKNQQQMIDHAAELDDFLHSKYTNQELYSWMDGSIRTLHYQAYTLAYDMALKAQKAYQFERPNETVNFITSGYWNSGRDGLLAGQSLLNDLKQLQAASQEKRGYDFEIVKHVSLRQWCPMVLFSIRETGTAEFELPEMLFDMDFPGHYLRRISSVSVTIPCVVGPYVSINGTVRLLSHKYRIRPQATDAADYQEKMQENGDDRFGTTLLPNYALALSSGVNDSGILDLKTATEMYNPIEGAGTISRWRLELPDAFRQFDYNSISDVIFHISYTSLDGGDRLKQIASASITSYVKSVTDLSREQGLFALVNVKTDFSQQWYQVFHTTTPSPPAAASPPATATPTVNATITLANLANYLPMFARHAAKVTVTDIFLLSSGVSQASLTAGSTLSTFTKGSPINDLNVLVISNVQLVVGEWTLSLMMVPPDLRDCWLLLRYTLG